MKKIVDYILLLLYTACLYTLWQLCQWGGVRSHLRRLLPLAALLLIALIVKLVLRHKGFHAPHVRARVATFAGITVLFGGLIVYSAIPYHGQLSWKIDDLLHHKKIEFTHTNLYTDGVEGILTDVETKIALPEKLYISNSFSAEFTADGTITSVDTMLYGENEQGEMKTYLIHSRMPMQATGSSSRMPPRVPASTVSRSRRMPETSGPASTKIPLMAVRASRRESSFSMKASASSDFRAHPATDPASS